MSNIIGHRGKDISTILASERTEKTEATEGTEGTEGTEVTEGTEAKRPQRVVARRKKRRRLNDLDSDSNLDEDESEDEFRISEGSVNECCALPAFVYLSWNITFGFYMDVLACPYLYLL